MPTAANLMKLNLCVVPALPMQDEAYRLAFTRGDDLFESNTKETLCSGRLCGSSHSLGRSRAKASNSRFCASASGF
jgi:hypothetical protein